MIAVSSGRRLLVPRHMPQTNYNDDQRCTQNCASISSHRLQVVDGIATVQTKHLTVHTSRNYVCSGQGTCLYSGLQSACKQHTYSCVPRCREVMPKPSKSAIKLDSDCSTWACTPTPPPHHVHQVGLSIHEPDSRKLRNSHLGSPPTRKKPRAIVWAAH